jgi:transmembrane sensor
MTPDRQPSARNPRDAAAHWFARVQSGDMDVAEQVEFETWRTADDLHAREYASLQRIWNVAKQIPSERLRALAENGEFRGRRTSASGRWRHAGVAAVCLIVVGMVAGVYQWQQMQPVFTAGVGTMLGERRSIALPDGSSMDVNTQTRVQIRYYRDRRIVELVAVEATFSVDPDAQRPFIVDAGKGSVRVTGTRFNVRRDGEAVTVAVLSGRVEVSGVARAVDAPAVLTAGQAVHVDAQGRVGESHLADVAALAAWREGKLVFDDASLAYVVREVARYRAQPIRLSGADVAQLRLSSTFSVNNTDALLEALPRVLPVKVRTLPDGSAEIYRP